MKSESVTLPEWYEVSHLIRGAWIEIRHCRRWILQFWKSHLIRGAWIEIPYDATYPTAFRPSHLIRGAWIEIVVMCLSILFLCSRISYEVRGLKFVTVIFLLKYLLSHLIRGAWIEMPKFLSKPFSISVASHTRCVD